MNPQRRMNRGIGILIGLTIFFVAVLSVRCNEGESPVSFTPDLPDASNLSGSSSSSNGNPGVQPPSIDTPAKQRYSYDILSKEDLFQVEITSTGSTSGRVGVACYENPDHTAGENQEYFSSHIHNIVAGATRTVQTKIPECVFWQCDAFEGDPIINEDPFYGRRLIVGRSGGPQGDCSPPPPPPPGCDLEQLRRDAASECDEENFELNIPQCSFTCNPEPPCEPTGEPECQEQSWDTNTCQWIGECECEEEITNFREFFEGECEERIHVTITEFTDCTGATRQERVETPAPEECEPPVCEPEGENPGRSCDEDGGGLLCFWDNTPEVCQWVCVPDETCEPPQACVYEYGGPPTDKETECLALTDNAFWSDGSQHCVIPLPGVSADKWNLTPGQSHPECLRKQDD